MSMEQRAAERLDGEAKTAAWNEELDTVIYGTLDRIESTQESYITVTKVPFPCGKYSEVFNAAASSLRAKGVIVSNRYLSGAYMGSFNEYYACWGETAAAAIPYDLEPMLEVIGNVIDDYDKMQRWPRFLKKKRMPYAVDVRVPRRYAIEDECGENNVPYKVKRAVDMMLKSSDLEVLGYIPAYTNEDRPVKDRLIIYIGVCGLLDRMALRASLDPSFGSICVKAKGEPYKFTCENKLTPMRPWVERRV